MKLETLVKWGIPIMALGMYAFYRIGKEDEQELYLKTIRELNREAIVG